MEWFSKDAQTFLPFTFQVGASIYLGACFVGIPLAPVLRDSLKFFGSITMCAIFAGIGYLMMYFSTGHQIDDSFASVFVFAGFLGLASGCIFGVIQVKKSFVVELESREGQRRDSGLSRLN